MRSASASCKTEVLRRAWCRVTLLVVLFLRKTSRWLASGREPVQHKTEKSMAGHERHSRKIGDVPGTRNDAARVGVAFQLLHHLGNLVVF
jgi:hypothetical protein